MYRPSPPHLDGHQNAGTTKRWNSKNAAVTKRYDRLHLSGIHANFTKSPAWPQNIAELEKHENDMAIEAKRKQVQNFECEIQACQDALHNIKNFTLEGGPESHKIAKGKLAESIAVPGLKTADAPLDFAALSDKSNGLSFDHDKLELKDHVERALYDLQGNAEVAVLKDDNAKKGLSKVLGLPTQFWKGNEEALVEGDRNGYLGLSRAYWPSLAEFKEEGEDRSKKNLERRLPLPKLDRFSDAVIERKLAGIDSKDNIAIKELLIELTKSSGLEIDIDQRQIVDYKGPLDTLESIKNRYQEDEAAELLQAMTAGILLVGGVYSDADATEDAADGFGIDGVKYQNLTADNFQALVPNTVHNPDNVMGGDCGMQPYNFHTDDNGKNNQGHGYVMDSEYVDNQEDAANGFSMNQHSFQHNDFLPSEFLHSNTAFPNAVHAAQPQQGLGRPSDDVRNWSPDVAQPQQAHARTSDNVRNWSPHAARAQQGGGQSSNDTRNRNAFYGYGATGYSIFQNNGFPRTGGNHGLESSYLGFPQSFGNNEHRGSMHGSSLYNADFSGPSVQQNFHNHVLTQVDAEIAAELGIKSFRDISMPEPESKENWKSTTIEAEIEVERGETKNLEKFSAASPTQGNMDETYEPHDTPIDSVIIADKKARDLIGSVLHEL